MVISLLCRKLLGLLLIELPVGLKEQFCPNSKIHIFLLTCRAFQPSRLFWWELQSFGDIHYRITDFSPKWLNQMAKNTFEDSTIISQDLVTEDNIQTLLWAVAWKNYFLRTKLYPPAITFMDVRLTKLSAINVYVLLQWWNVTTVHLLKYSISYIFRCLYFLFSTKNNEKKAEYWNRVSRPDNQ